MRKYKFLLAVIVVITTSCQKYFIEEPLVVQSVETSNPYAISEQEALDGLDEFMGAFDDSQTRYNRRRSVRSIRSVSSENILIQTRASACDDVGDLLYIVEFEDGEGSAILGADRRLRSVYAVLDESVLTIDDFANAANVDDGNDVAAFIAGVISDDVCYTMSDFGGPAPLIPPGDSLRSDWSDIITTYVVSDYIPPLLNTKWCQTDIYNERFPANAAVYNGRQSAGCVTIALGQILNKLTYPSPIELNGHNHYWRDINQFVWNHTITDSVLCDKVADFVFDLSEELGVEYHDDGSTGASKDDVKRVLRQLNFKNLDFGNITKSRVYPMLYNYKPVFAGGQSSSGGAGHAWVIDGYKTVTRLDFYVTYNGANIEIDRELIYQLTTDYVHCNMGYEGKCDGYYVLDMFDLSERKYDSDLEPDYGDKTDTTYYYKFDRDLETLIYNY